MDEADSYIAQWLRRDPSMELAAVFTVSSERRGFMLWGALVHALDDALHAPSEAAVSEAKLAWWGEELLRGAGGHARHPLVHAWFEQPCAHRVEAVEWSRLLQAALTRVREESAPIDIEAALRRHARWAERLAEIESRVMLGPTPAAALAIEAELRALLPGATRTRLRLPLQLLARHQVTADAMMAAPEAEPQRALRRDYAAELLRRLPSAAPAPLFRRCRTAIDHWRLEAIARGSTPALAPAPLSRLSLVWRAARAGRH